MFDLAALLGRLAGSMLNPVVWVIVAATLYFARSRGYLVQCAIAMAGTLVTAIAFYSFDPQLTFAEKERGTLFGLLAAFAGLTIVSGIIKLVRRR